MVPASMRRGAKRGRGNPDQIGIRGGLRMRKNQIILDDAARSVRRAFLSSVAGSATMLGVIGVAGAYGMPERLSAHSLSSALTTLQIKLTPMVDAAQPAVERAEAVAGSFKQRVQSVAIESD